MLLVAFGYFVVRPAAERLLQGLGGLAAVIATQASEAIVRTHAIACRAIEQDPAVQALLAGPVTCAPAEDATWLPPLGQRVAFEFAVESDSGKQATAYVVATLFEDGPRLESIVVSGDAGSVLVLALP